MKKLLKYTLVIFILSLKVYSQNYTQEYSDSISKNWKFFKLEQSEKAIIVDHTPIQILCGTSAFASVTIVKNTKGETFRVLNLCNLQNFKPHEEIKISSQKAPSFNVNFAKKYVIVLKNGKEVIQNINYEETIIRTTWASMEKIKL